MVSISPVASSQNRQTDLDLDFVCVGEICSHPQQLICNKWIYTRGVIWAKTGLEGLTFYNLLGPITIVKVPSSRRLHDFNLLWHREKKRQKIACTSSRLLLRKKVSFPSIPVFSDPLSVSFSLFAVIPSHVVGQNCSKNLPKVSSPFQFTREATPGIRGNPEFYK